MTIHVLNPNSLADVTQGIDDAIAPMRAGAPVGIEVHTLAAGPPGIETQAHIDGVIAPLLAQAKGLSEGAAAFVIACYSDPGLAQMRAAVPVPVFGIAESAVLTAMRRAERFGVISILDGSIPRHMAYLERMGVQKRCAGDRALGLGVQELADEARTFRQLQRVGSELVDKDGAGALILGCAGMARYRRRLEQVLNTPVIDPCQAATAMAIGALALSAAE